jgi:hypothetical protein
MIDRYLTPEEIKRYFEKFDAQLRPLCLRKEIQEHLRAEGNHYNYFVPGFCAPVAKLGLYVRMNLSDDGIDKEEWCVELNIAIRISLVTKKIVTFTNTAFETDLLVERERTFQEEFFEEGLDTLKKMLPIYKQLATEAKQIELKKDFL